MLEETYDQMSLTTLAIRVEQMTVNLTDHPVRCLRAFESSEEDTLSIIRGSFLRDFAVSAATAYCLLVGDADDVDDGAGDGVDDVVDDDVDDGLLLV